MNSLTLKLFLVALVVVAAFAKTEDEEWEAYKSAHGKKMKDAKEEALRKANFLRTDKKIKENNAKGVTFKMAHNEFSDWTDEEKKVLAGRKTSEAFTVAEIDPMLEMSERQTLPAALDYRNDSCMPAIKNQGSCGSCWAFSTIATLEFLVCKSGKKTTLSEQQLVDCACSGCNGGDYYPAWQYLNANTASGAVAASGYSYTGVEGTCKSATGLIKPLTWNRIQYNVTTIMNALKTYGVLAIAMDVQDSFLNYATGIYQGTDCSSAYSALNHAMALVGYGKDSATGLDFWVVRNSWGNGWGEAGYIRVRRGVNVCGVETDVGYVKTNLAVTL